MDFKGLFGSKSHSEDQIVMMLRDGEGKSIDDIATQLNISLRTVKNRLARGRASLRDEIQHREPINGAAHIQSLLSEYMDGRLIGPDLDRVKSHLVFCNACRQALHDYEDNRRSLKGKKANMTPLPIPAKKTAPAMRPKFNPAWAWRGVALIGASLFVLYVFTAKQTPSPSSPQATPQISPEPSPIPTPEWVSTPTAAVFPSPVAPNNKELSTSAVVPPVPLSAAISKIDVKDQTKIIDNQQFKELSGSNSGLVEPIERVIGTQQEWKNIWKIHTESVTPAPPLPVVDFEISEVLILSAGNKPSGGYSLALQNIEETEWEGKTARVFNYILRTPPENALTTSVITQPFLIKVIPRKESLNFFKIRR